MGDCHDTLKFSLIPRATNKTEQSRGGSTDAAGLIDAQEVLTQFGNDGAKAPRRQGNAKARTGKGQAKKAASRADI